MRTGERVFVDTGAWIALAVVRDTLHERARLEWNELMRRGARLFSSIAVVLETFTYLDRRGSRELALRWQQGIGAVRDLTIVDCRTTDLAPAWRYFDDRTLHKLSLVDALSFVIMRQHKIKTAFAFDTHFVQAGFRVVT